MKIILSGAILACFTTVLFGQVDQSRSGNWWRDLPELERVLYATGLMDGIYAEERVQGADASYFAMSAQLGEVTAGQLADGITAFYRDYRNRQIRVALALFPVVASIHGTTPEQIESLVISLRSGGNITVGPNVNPPPTTSQTPVPATSPAFDPKVFLKLSPVRPTATPR